MTAALFLGFVLITAAFILWLAALYLPRRTSTGLFVTLPAWLVYVGVLGYLGVIRRPDLRPPGIVFIFLPALLFVIVVLVRSPAGGRIALAIPLWILLGMQCFRIGVELFLHQLWKDGLAPKMLTFLGANVDIYIGLTAPLIAWLSRNGNAGRRLSLFWNVLGLLVLANVVIRAVLTTPGPLNLIHSEIPNRAIGTFPFMFIPGFFVPLAVALHVLSIRALLQRQLTPPEVIRN